MWDLMDCVFFCPLDLLTGCKWCDLLAQCEQAGEYGHVVCFATEIQETSENCGHDCLGMAHF